MKRNITIFLTLVIAVSALLSACDKTSEASSSITVPSSQSGSVAAPGGGVVSGNGYPLDGSGKTPGGVEFSSAGSFPIVSEKIDMKIAIPYYSYVTDYENNDLTKYMEDMTNVRILWDLLPEKDFPEKVNLMMSSGANLPDVLMDCRLTNETLITFGSQGLIIPLNDLITRHQRNFKELCDAHSNVIPSITAPDGNIYALPSYARSEPNTYAMRFWINKPFMDALNITKLPETTDEFYDYLVAVKNGDPNRNGNADEIPLVGATKGWFQNIDGFLMMPFIYNETSADESPSRRRRIYLTDDGQIEFAANKPQWKAGLEWMNKLCSEGLLAPESFTLDKEGLRALVESEEGPIVASLPSGGPHEFANTHGDRRKDYVALPPLSGPEGVRESFWDKYAGVQIGEFVITKDSRIADIAMKWADACYSEDVWLRGRYGVPERDWKLPAEGTVAVDGGLARYEEILKWGEAQNAHWGSRQVTWSRFGSHARAFDPDDPYELEHVLWNAHVLYAPYRFENVVPFDLFFTYDESRRYAELNKLVIDYVEQNLARFVTGDLDIESEWDTYVSELDKMGLPELLTLTQTAFDRQWQKTLGF